MKIGYCMVPVLAIAASAVAASGDPGKSSSAAGPWRKAAEEGGVTIYTRDKPGTPIKEVKAIGMIEAPPYACMNVVCDLGHFSEFMPYTNESTIVGREGDQVVFSYQHLKLPLVDNRDYTLRVVDETPPPGPSGEPAYYKSSWTPANERGPKPRSDTVRVVVNTGHWLFEPVDDGKRTRATYYLFTDPGGMIPSFVANRANTQAIPDLFKALRTQSRSERFAKPRQPKPALSQPATRPQ
ncbi:MAG: hypothetical protein JXR83_08035 [Deltaproteobacteria bacterium]|nr:hypothetical protein [Deltaproteobacteria bacterium]